MSNLKSCFRLRVVKVIVISIFSLILFACSRPASTPDATLFEEQMMVMGTLVSITISGENETKTAKVFHNLLKDFKYMQAAWNPWKKGSLARINQLLPTKSAFSIGPAMQAIMQQSVVLFEQSEGLFNPAIGNLVKLWGFNKDELPKGPPPDPASISRILQNRPLMSDLDIAPLSVSTRNASVLLDFGGFAKGYAVDKAIEYLKSENINNAIVNAGGDLRAIGTKAGKPWVIGIRNPREEGVIATLTIDPDESVFTSGDYERFYDYEGKRYHHILNPETGYPADQTTSVTIVHTNAAIADAAATALFVAGPAKWEHIAKRMGLNQVMLIDKSGNIFITDMLKKRINFKNEAKLNISVSSKL